MDNQATAFLIVFAIGFVLGFTVGVDFTRAVFRRQQAMFTKSFSLLLGKKD